LAKWINVEILKRLALRFRLRDTPETELPLKLSQLVVLTAQVDDLLQSANVSSITLDLTGAGIVTFFTVPGGKRWRLLAIRRDQTTGTTAIDIYQGAGKFYRLGSWGTPGEQFLLGKDFILEESWYIAMSGTSNAGDGARGIYIWYIEEDSF